jgi:hypothetical protein
VTRLTSAFVAFTGCVIFTGSPRSFKSLSVPRSCTRDEGRSLGVGLQELASNHLKLLW